MVDGASVLGVIPLLPPFGARTGRFRSDDGRGRVRIGVVLVRPERSLNSFNVCSFDLRGR